jgi:Polysaccharide pyruvyl transferase
MPGSEAPQSIGFVGTFEVANYGDCLFPVVYMHLLKERLGNLEFSFHSPLAQSAGIMDYGPINALPDKLSNLRFDANVLILCGGETLWFGHSSGTFNFPSSTLSAYARLWLGPTVAASRGMTDFYVHCVGMPHAELEAPPEIADALSSATKVCVRDEVTARRLGNRFPVKVDPVFALSTLKSSEDWKTELNKWLPSNFAQGRYLAAHISSPYLKHDLHDWCEQVAKVAKLQEVPVLLVPVCHFMDDRHTLETARQILIELGMGPEQVQLPPVQSKDVIATAAMLGLSGGVITSSLHACVTAASFGAPFAGYVGKGKGNGKHRQTLLAAGVDFGMSMDINDIFETFAYALKQDRQASRTEAISRALNGFDELVYDLNAKRGSSVLVSEATIDAVLRHDTAPTRDLRFEAKRTILRLANKSLFLAGILTERRRARMRKGAA